MKKSFIFLLSFLFFVSCSKEDDDSPILGTWNELYNVTTSYDIETGVILNNNVSAWGAVIDFRSSGNLIYRYKGINFNGKYVFSGKELELIVESDTTLYNIDEISSERMILSKENVIQGKTIRERQLRVLGRPDYQLTLEDINNIYSPNSTN